MASPKKANCTPEEWAAHLAAGRAYRAEHRERDRARDRDRYQRDVEKIKARNSAYGARPTSLERRKAQQRMRISGVSTALFQALWDAQGGKCAVCTRDLILGAKTHADHCHDEKKPRGLLCSVCNTVEGLIKSIGLSPDEFGQRLVAYLKNPPAANVCDLI